MRRCSLGVNDVALDTESAKVKGHFIWSISALGADQSRRFGQQVTPADGSDAEKGPAVTAWFPGAKGAAVLLFRQSSPPNVTESRFQDLGSRHICAGSLPRVL